MNPTANSQVSKLESFKKFATNPWTVLGCVILGVFLGIWAPEFSKDLAVVGVVYVDLLKMIVLPFMVSAVIFSLQKLFRDGGAAKVLGRVVVVFLAISVFAAIISAAGGLVLKPGGDITPEVRIALGNLVGADTDSSNTDMAFRKAELPPKPLTLQEILTSLIPSNIFASLANGETLKALVFALLFGFAIGQVPGRLADGLSQSLETIYLACQTLTRWVNLPVPVVLVCMTASQFAQTGIKPLYTMMGFVISFVVISALLLLISIFILSHRSGRSFSEAMNAMRDTFTLGVATNNSTTCMPAMVDGLVTHLNFARSRVELLVPLSVSLLRMGAIAYFVCGTMFVAALYGRPLALSEIALIVGVSVMSGFASAGMAGILTISLVGTVCNYLGLPFEAAFILFVAVDPICAMARTTVTVIGACSAVSLICPKPETVAEIPLAQFRS
jgi:Na+/H+-dicarboxylate symporter